MSKAIIEEWKMKNGNEVFTLKEMQIMALQELKDLKEDVGDLKYKFISKNTFWKVNGIILTILILIGGYLLQI